MRTEQEVQRIAKITRAAALGAAVMGLSTLLIGASKGNAVAKAAKVLVRHDPELSTVGNLMFHQVHRGRSYTSFEVWALVQAHVLLECCVATVALLAAAVALYYLARRIASVTSGS